MSDKKNEKKAAVDLKELSNEELIAIIGTQDEVIDGLKKKVANQKEYAAGLSKKIKSIESTPTSGANKTVQH